VKHDDSNKQRPSHSIGDGQAVEIGSLAGAVGGILLGLLAAWSTGPGWSLTSVIIVAHVTVAMIAMGAWPAIDRFRSRAAGRSNAASASS
jgi:hypothetical protein